jgi:hypothetical protein
VTAIRIHTRRKDGPEDVAIVRLYQRLIKVIKERLARPDKRDRASAIGQPSTPEAAGAGPEVQIGVFLRTSFFAWTLRDETQRGR